MNLELVENFGLNYPEESDGVLECFGNSLCCRFNRWGSLLAVGCNDGRIVIFDFITRGICKTIPAHVQPIVSLSWSRNGRRLLSASSDNTVAIWEVLTGDLRSRFRFSTLITSVQFHPRDEGQVLVCAHKQAIVVSAETGSHRFICLDDPSDTTTNDPNVVAVYDRRGKYILCGNGKGRVTVVDAESLRIVTFFRLPSSQVVKTMTVSRRGDTVLTNSGDRVIRVYSLTQILLYERGSIVEPMQKLQDMVNKTPWRTCALSREGDYVCAGSQRCHALYIWEKSSGSLQKILQGTKGEMLVDVQWHPCRPLICSVSNGIVSVWAQAHVENWSAFAPDFKELDENVKYEERESEFDVDDEDRSVQLNAHEQEGDELIVDVVSTRAPAAFCSSDEENDEEVLDARAARDGNGPLWYLPHAPEIENPDEQAYIASATELANDGSKPLLDATISPRNAFEVDIVLPGDGSANARKRPATVAVPVPASQCKAPPKQRKAVK